MEEKGDTAIITMLYQRERQIDYIEVNDREMRKKTGKYNGTEDKCSRTK